MKLADVALALAGGALWGLQFGAEPFVLLPWVALAPLIYLVGRPRPGRLAFLFGLAAWGVSLYWIEPTLATYGQIPAWLAWASTAFLAAYLSVDLALFGWLAAPVLARGGAIALAGVPALYVTFEWARGLVFNFFPWNLAAYAWIDVPGVLAVSSWIGAYGVSYLVALVATGWAMAWTKRSWRLAASVVLSVVLLLSLAGRFVGTDDPVTTIGQPVRVLQPNIPNSPEYDAEVAARNYVKVLDLAREACDRGGALLVWPESAAWPYSYSRDAVLRRDVNRLAAAGCPVLLNSAHKAEEGVWFNSAFLVGDGGDLERPSRYDKRHLVPFGEYVPYGGFFGLLNRLARNAGDFSPAEEVRLLSWGPEEIGMAICFEVTFPAEVAAAVREGATVLATMTNDAWYGDTSAPWQHLRAARFRAAENRRPMLRAAITGVSAVIGPDGKIEQQLGVGEEGFLRASIAGSRRRTLFTRLPLAVPVACLAGSLFVIFLARRRRS